MYSYYEIKLTNFELFDARRYDALHSTHNFPLKMLLTKNKKVENSPEFHNIYKIEQTIWIKRIEANKLLIC